MTIIDMIAELERYGITAERKSIYDDIEALRHYGIDIATRKSKTMDYFVASRVFELPELKLLVDAVQCSKFITHKKSNELIKRSRAWQAHIKLRCFIAKFMWQTELRL